MSLIIDGNYRSWPAGSDLSAKQYYLVKLSSGNLALTSAATDKIIGVLVNAPLSGDDGVVRLLSSTGTGKVKTGGSGSAGDKLTSDGNGKAITTTTSTNRVFGIALTDFTSGDVVEYLPVTEVVA